MDMKKIVVAIVSAAVITVGAGMAFAGGGEALFKKKCKACHNITAKKKVGPGMAGVLGRVTPKNGTMDKAGLTAWLTDPKAINPKSRMPNLRLKADEVSALVDYLSTL